MRSNPSPAELGFATRLSHAGRPEGEAPHFVNPALHRGSTVLQPNVAARVQAGRHRFD